MKVMKAQADAACKYKFARSSRTSQEGGSSYIRTIKIIQNKIEVSNK
jgi:hypothetical protein